MRPPPLGRLDDEFALRAADAKIPGANAFNDRVVAVSDRVLRSFAAVWFSYFAAIGLFLMFAPLWFKQLGLSTLAIGAIASLQAWTRVVAPYAWGWLADHSGQRTQLLRVAVVLSAMSALALALTGHWGLAAVLVCVAGLYLSNGAVMPLTEAALARHLRTESGMDTGRYGRVRVWGSMGFIVSVLGFGVLLQAVGLGSFPWLVVLMFGVLAAVLWRLPNVRDAAAHDAAAPGALAVLRRPEVAWFFAGIFFTVLAHTSLYAFFSLYISDLGGSESTIGLLWAIGVTAEVIFFWYQGRWFGRLSAHGWLLLAAGVAVLRFAAIALSGGNLVLLMLTQLTHAITFAAQHGACISLVSAYFPGRLRGRGQALYSTLGYGASGVIGGVAGGALIERWGYTTVFWAASAAALLSVGCHLRSRHHARLS